MIRFELGDSSTVIKEKLENECIDLVLCSPPYDTIRTYGGLGEFTLERFYLIAEELNRVLKKGGKIVWVVGDEVINGSESCSSFKQALYFKEVLGLNLHDTMIYEKNASSFPARKDGSRCSQIFEYMFVFSKGCYFIV